METMLPMPYRNRAAKPMTPQDQGMPEALPMPSTPQFASPRLRNAALSANRMADFMGALPASKDPLVNAGRQSTVNYKRSLADSLAGGGFTGQKLALSADRRANTETDSMASLNTMMGKAYGSQANLTQANADQTMQMLPGKVEGQNFANLQNRLMLPLNLEGASIANQVAAAGMDLPYIKAAEVAEQARQKQIAAEAQQRVDMTIALLRALGEVGGKQGKDNEPMFPSGQTSAAAPANPALEQILNIGRSIGTPSAAPQGTAAAASPAKSPQNPAQRPFSARQTPRSVGTPVQDGQGRKPLTATNPTTGEKLVFNWKTMDWEPANDANKPQMSFGK